MGSLTVRNIEDDTKERLRVVAAQAGHSMEEHVRQLIANEVRTSQFSMVGFGTWVHQLFEGIQPVDFDVPTRDELAEPMDLPQ